MSCPALHKCYLSSPLFGFKLAHRLSYRDNSFNNDSKVINSIFPKKQFVLDVLERKQKNLMMKTIDSAVKFGPIVTQ